jgi:Ca-activated chloride channel family protein
MNFNQFSYWPGLVLLFAVFLMIVVLMERRFFRFVKTYWFYNRSIFSYISTLLFLAGMGGLLISLLDIRGPEEKIKMQIPSDRTIILIDTSASMLAEDVKPSRLQKAALIAKHFVRKAAGHQLSIVAFAEVQKKIVPFTNDVDLIDARLDSLENLRNQYGSSALTSAVQESIQYFKETGGEESGNILVFTDGEETAEGIDLKVPKGIHVAFVGVGTSQGGRIPLDDGRGFRFGYKKVQGRDVITKLHEDFFKRVTADIPSSKYWLANSYSLPSEEILDFFKSEKVKGNDQQDMVIKPVLMEWIVIPSLLLIFASYFFKALRIFSLGLLLIITPVKAQDNQDQPQLSPETIEKMNELQKGELNQLEKIKLADDLNKAGAKEEALALYDESLPFPIDKKIPPEAYLNYGTALMSKGEAKKGLDVYEDLKASGVDSKTQDIMDKNVVSFFQQQEQKKKEEEQKKNKDKQENKDQQDQNKDQQNQSGQDQQKNQQNQSGQQKNQKDQKQNGEDQKKEEKKDKGENKDEKKEDENKDQNKDEENKDDKGEKGEEDKKPMPPKKIPAKLKQLMSDDRQLQMKMIENGTRDLNKRKSRKSKDW